ncbi:MAG: transposase family protein [bacterium]|nr:transposase family protein [bacterium]
MKQVPAEALVELQRRLSTLPPRSAERRLLVEEKAHLYGVSTDTLYRALREKAAPKALRRSDHGVPRVMSAQEMERLCEVIAAIKVRTSNRKGRHLSTAEAIRLLEDLGIKTPEGYVQVPKAVLKKTTVNRYLKQWGYDHRALGRPPPAVRFQAHHSNECWHFDLSPSDLKHVKQPEWFEEGRGRPLLMIYSVVDDRSGVCYQEYHGVYGEDVEAALRFLFAAMSPKPGEDFPFQGIPAMIYTDNGPIAKSRIFLRVMDYLGIEVHTHMPQRKGSRKANARAKGKVERPFRTVKEMHETLFHFHQPKNETEANAWLTHHLVRYNGMGHRSECHSRIEDWLQNVPASGLREMCNWDRYCTFAREPERRLVGVDARIVIGSTKYEVDPGLAGETVILWWGVFDNELYVEHGERRYGPYIPVDGPIPLHRYRQFKKSRAEKRADRVETLAGKLELPRAALEGGAVTMPEVETENLPAAQPFTGRDPFQELHYTSAIAAKKAIASELGIPLAKLPGDQMTAINTLVSETLDKPMIEEFVRTHLKPQRGA